MGIDGDGQQREGLELLVRPGPLRHPPAIRLQHRERCGGIPRSQVNPGPGQGKIVRLGQVRGRRHVAQLQQRQHLGSSDLGHSINEVALAHGLLGLRQHGGRAGRISPGQLQASQEDFTDGGSINRANILPRQWKALLPVLFGGIQVVPLIEYASQANELLIGIRS